MAGLAYAPVFISQIFASFQPALDSAFQRFHAGSSIESVLATSYQLSNFLDGIVQTAYMATSAFKSY